MQSDTPISRMVLPNRVFFSEVNSLLEQGNSVTLTAKGDSMIPFIQGGRDMVVLRKPEMLSVGDIVLASVDDGGYVLHRIMRIEGERVLLMGDGNIRQTEQCTLGDITGKVTHIIRKGRRTECDVPAERMKAMIWRRLLPVRHALLFLFRLWNRPARHTCREMSSTCG